MRKPKVKKFTYPAKAIHFTGANEMHPDVEFADNDYVKDLDHVVDILNGDPSLQVTVEGSVGIDVDVTVGPVGIETGELDESGASVPSKVGLPKSPPTPLGRTEAAYAKYGWLMDARANRVRDELVKRGISANRIHPARGEAQMGSATRTVKFIFDSK